ncbi:thiosulfate oxidation carrier complex protein SoxZ [Phreatobacter sp.]|uniref:thiosulfate oxidation carrier complex protein SoxZ n=1 Tax=Phreatobacter sp. TaxID=1966341 RepID=UPI003F71F96A
MTSATIPARITMPAEARRGDIVEIRVLVRHAMERGVSAQGLTPVPRRILHTFRATYDGAEIMRMDLSPGIAANPYIAFTTRATVSADIVFEWLEDGGVTYERRQMLTVT